MSVTPKAEFCSRARKLRALIESRDLCFLMEAHNGLSARIVQEAGFEAIWGSGLSISASLGLRDNNEATWTQVLEVLEFMADAASIPILVDGDSGFGDFNTTRRFVRKLEERGIAGVCIEDKLFPKANSFVRGKHQRLARVEDFASKIRAACDTRRDSDFVVVARTEALVAGLGVLEALRRAEVYMESGADAILVHSAESDPGEVFSFLSAWENRLPVVLVPTKYYDTPTSEFVDRDVAAVIWANHNLRSSIAAMETTSARIYRNQSVQPIEADVASLSEVFRLQRVDELAEAERRYVVPSSRGARALILPGRSCEPESIEGSSAESPPKCDTKQARPSSLAQALRLAGVRELIAAGRHECGSSAPTHADEALPQRACRDDVGSLRAAGEFLDGEIIVCRCDALYKPLAIRGVCESTHGFSVLVDTGCLHGSGYSPCSIYASCSHEASDAGLDEPILLRKFVTVGDEEDIHGEWTGLLRVSPSVVDHFREMLDELAESSGGELCDLGLSDLVMHVVEKGHPVEVMYSIGAWSDSRHEVRVEAPLGRA